jgi:hypothetical protein
MQKKVAFAWYFFRVSKTQGLCSAFGPSSKLRYNEGFTAFGMAQSSLGKNDFIKKGVLTGYHISAYFFQR